MSQKSVIVAIVSSFKSGSYGKGYLLDGQSHPNKEVWSTLNAFCDEYGLKINTMVRKDFPFECTTEDKFGNKIEWLIDKCEIFRKGGGGKKKRKRLKALR